MSAVACHVSEQQMREGVSVDLPAVTVQLVPEQEAAQVMPWSAPVELLIVGEAQSQQAAMPTGATPLAGPSPRAPASLVSGDFLVKECERLQELGLEISGITEAMLLQVNADTRTHRDR